MSIIVKNIHIFKDGAWRPIKKVFKDNSWRTMRGIFYQGDWYEIGGIDVPDGCAISTTVHPRWNEYSTYYGTDNFGFNALPGGAREHTGDFVGLGTRATWWSSTESISSMLWVRNMNYDGSSIKKFAVYKEVGFPVRCVKDYTGSQPNGTILSHDYEDGDGNLYDAVVLGEQLWTIENLYTTKYQNSVSIPNVTDDTDWRYFSSGAYCWYNNDEATWGVYGAIYNGFAISGLVDNNGYRVPSDADWTQLTDYLINTTWYNGVDITSNNIAQYLKSCRQVNHPLA